MHKDISIFISCRIDGNKNSAILICLQRIFENAANPSSVEVLIKFDDDDSGVAKVLEELKTKPYFENIRYIFAPRWGGYSDLHKAYNALLEIVNPESRIYWIVSDDAEIMCKGWDKLIMDKVDIFADGIFVMHGSPLVKMGKKTMLEAIEKCDPYPIWSKKWIRAAGSFGETFSTDGLSSILERELFNRYGLDRRIFIPQLDITRHTRAEDFGNSVKWDVKRKAGIDHMMGDDFRPRFDKMVDEIYKQTSKSVRADINKLINSFYSNRYYKKINKKIRRANRKNFYPAASQV